MSVRQRRLKADYERMWTLFSGKSRIRVLQAVGSPPEKYQIEFLVASLQKERGTGDLRSHNSFIAEITLLASYPRLAPQCRMLTPVFHPNIAPHAICIGDHWAAGESLPALVVRIAEMLAFQSYNVKSPLNGEAAQWVERNRDALPLDTFDFNALLDHGEAAGAADRARGGVCANCGTPAEKAELRACANQHLACPDCLVPCPVCGAELCLKCARHTCTLCGRAVCPKCILKCGLCGRQACATHTAVCHVCGRPYCTDCIVTCDACGKPTCVGDIRKTEADGEKRYLCTACAA